MGDIWRVLGAAGDAVGDIVIDEADFPWLHGRFVPGPGFATVEPLFHRELELLERYDEDETAGEEWEAVYADIGRAVSLVSPTGPVAEFLLHIEGDRAWFRWSDEPFGE
ncbi:hypothetical protein ABZ208_16490 [Streptomyces sp. NPDC006208]|uniref:hypothetical protein n=1 Tax=Streptomyces sp. NPDC006208 TaxID=3156734 RepID=UPI0033AF2AE7